MSAVFIGNLGRGYLKECMACEGRGSIPYTAHSRDAGLETECRTCRGRGLVLKQDTWYSIAQDKRQPVLYSADGGVTQDALKFWRLHRGTLGRVTRVRAIADRSGCLVFVEGTDAVMLLEGFHIGYGGEGPRGLVTLLEEAGLPHKASDVFEGSGVLDFQEIVE